MERRHNFLFNRSVANDCYSLVNRLPKKVISPVGNDISKREDDNSVYFEIKCSDLKSTKCDTKVKNGYLLIYGTTESNSGSDEKCGLQAGRSFFRSSF